MSIEHNMLHVKTVDVDTLGSVIMEEREEEVNTKGTDHRYAKGATIICRKQFRECGIPC